MFKTSKIIWWSLLTTCLLVSCGRKTPAQPSASISGVVLDGAVPVPGAAVRVKTTNLSTVTDADGRFTLIGLDEDELVKITAWASGYYIVGLEKVKPGTRDAVINLHAHHTSDNPDYAWLPTANHAGEGENQGCAECHSREGAELAFALPVDEWLLDAHAQAAVNPRFLTMYTGQDMDGNSSPQTRYGFSRDYGRFPLRPDPNQPYYGPGYKLDFPETAGNCAACHTPLAAVNTPYGVDPTQLDGVVTEGVSCDFCHKVWDVRLNSDTGLPYPNMPGVLSFEFRRPPNGHQFFAGPLDDVAPGEDTYSPLQQQSQYCAPCHFGIFWDTVVYNSFGEWLASPYSDPETGRTCQDCHMPPTGATHFALPGQGGEARDPNTIFSHRMPGASDETLLQNAVTLTATVRPEGGQLQVEVAITNDQTGHHVPTDSPLRHLILLLEAAGQAGQPLAQLDGPTVPEWGGSQAGRPGKAFALLLEELWTGVSPTGAYWNPTRMVIDNRIPALSTDRSRYAFVLPADGQATVRVTLLFRRAFQALMDQKGWDVPDIVMEQQTLTIP